MLAAGGGPSFPLCMIAAAAAAATADECVNLLLLQGRGVRPAHSRKPPQCLPDIVTLLITTVLLLLV